MVVEVLVTQDDRRDPLGDQGALVMDDEHGMTGVGDDGVEGVEEADPVGDLADQECPGIRREAAALEVGDDDLGPEGGKRQGAAVTVCHRDGLARDGSGL